VCVFHLFGDTALAWDGKTLDVKRATVLRRSRLESLF